MNFEKALYHLSELEELFEGNPYQGFLYSHLISIQVELKRQQSLTKDHISPKLGE